jgi:hypothetical protein
VLLINSHERDFMMAASAATFEMIDACRCSTRPAKRRAHRTVFHPGGGSSPTSLQTGSGGPSRAIRSRRDVRREELQPLHEFNWDVKSKDLAERDHEINTRLADFSAARR